MNLHWYNQFGGILVKSFVEYATIGICLTDGGHGFWGGIYFTEIKCYFYKVKGTDYQRDL